MNIEKLRSLKPCREGLEFAESFASLQEAWDSCSNASWMFWYLGKVGYADRKILVAIACDCAEGAMQYVPETEKRPQECLNVVRKWLRDEATLDEVKQAAADAAWAARAARSAIAAARAAHAADATNAAWSAAWAAADAAWAAADAAWAAADAARSAIAAARAAHAADATNAAWSAAWAAADAAHAAAWAARAAQSNIVRKYIPIIPSE